MNYLDSWMRDKKKGWKIKMFSIDNGECQARIKCDDKNKNKDLLIHHINHDRANNGFNNLIVLCRNCHTCIHGSGKLFRFKGRKSFKKFFINKENYMKKKNEEKTYSISSAAKALGVDRKTIKDYISKNIIEAQIIEVRVKTPRILESSLKRAYQYILHRKGSGRRPKWMLEKDAKSPMF